MPLLSHSAPPGRNYTIGPFASTIYISMPKCAPYWCDGCRGSSKSPFASCYLALFGAAARRGCSRIRRRRGVGRRRRAGGKGGGEGRRGGDVPVTVATATQKNVPVEVQVIGNVEAYSTITVKAQVGGQLTNVYFHEGDFVKKGDQLFTIDPRPLEAALNQAQANIARDQAALGQAQANLARDKAQARYAEAQANRYAAACSSRSIISKDQAEQLRANADAVAQAVDADQAAIESAKAAIGASQATVENAKVQLGYTTIRRRSTGAPATSRSSRATWSRPTTWT